MTERSEGRKIGSDDSTGPVSWCRKHLRLAIAVLVSSSALYVLGYTLRTGLPIGVVVDSVFIANILAEFATWAGLTVTGYGLIFQCFLLVGPGPASLTIHRLFARTNIKNIVIVAIGVVSQLIGWQVFRVLGLVFVVAAFAFMTGTHRWLSFLERVALNWVHILRR